MFDFVIFETGRISTVQDKSDYNIYRMLTFTIKKTIEVFENIFCLHRYIL